MHPSNSARSQYAHRASKGSRRGSKRRTGGTERVKHRRLTLETLEPRQLLAGDMRFGDSWGTLARSSSDGTTLDFSAVTGGLAFTINGDTVTVAYADQNRADRLTYTAAGKNYSIIGSQGNDQFLAVNDRQLTSLDGGAGADTVRFDSTIGLARTGATTTATRSDNSSFTLANIEDFTGHVSLGPAIRGEINQALDKWTGVATEFVQSELLAANIPVLKISLVEGLGQGFAASVPTTLAAAKTYATELLTVDTASLTGLTDLGALASSLQNQFNSVTSGTPFTVTAGIHDWSELRIDVSFGADADLGDRRVVRLPRRPVTRHDAGRVAGCVDQPGAGRATARLAGTGARSGREAALGSLQQRDSGPRSESQPVADEQRLDGRRGRAGRHVPAEGCGGALLLQ